MKYLLKNGTFVSGDQMKKADVLIENEKIAKTGPDLMIRRPLLSM